MHRGESPEVSGPSNKPSRKNIFVRFFRNHNITLKADSEIVQESNTTEEPFEMPFKNEGRPDYFHKAVPKLKEFEIEKILSDLGVERGADQVHIINYVGGVDASTVPDENQSFLEYLKENDLKDAQEVVSIYTGDLTREDHEIIRKLLGYAARDMKSQDRKVEMSKLSETARTLMEEVVVPNHLSFIDTLEIIQKDRLSPLSYYYNINMHADLSEDKKVLFWINDTYGGDITLSVGPTYNDSLAGPTADGEICVNLRGVQAGLLYWNSWHSNGVRWSVDPFIRSTILAENPDNQIYTKL